MNKKKLDAKGMELTERVVAINRVSKVVKGGKRFKFSVLVVVGDGDRYVGVGMGKAKEISEAVRKIDRAGRTFSSEEDRKHHSPSHHWWLRRSRGAPQACGPGTGVIAGGVVRAIMELGGVKDVVSKVIGRTSNPINIAWATMQAVEEMRTPDEILRFRGKKTLDAAAE